MDILILIAGATAVVGFVQEAAVRAFEGMLGCVVDDVGNAPSQTGMAEIPIRQMWTTDRILCAADEFWLTVAVLL